MALERQSKLKFELKKDNTPVTETEFSIEAFLIEKIRRYFPGHQILTEEQGLRNEDNDFVWTIDPIDGTKSYLRGFPGWGVAIGVLYKSEPIAGAFYMPVVNEMYWGTAEGAYLNNARLEPPTGRDIRDPMSFLFVPSNIFQNYDIRYPRIQAFGSTSAHLAYLLSGKPIGVLTWRVNLWDFAAILPMLNYLGLNIEYFSGKPLDISALMAGQRTPESVFAAHPDNLQAMREVIIRKAV